MKDKFPPAFRRFEEKVDIDDVKTLKELMEEFKNWGLKKAPITKKQRKGLAIEGVKIGIDPVLPVTYVRKEKEITYTTKTGKIVSYHQKLKIMQAHRNILTGRYSKEPRDRIQDLK